MSERLIVRECFAPPTGEVLFEAEGMRELELDGRGGFIIHDRSAAIFMSSTPRVGPNPLFELWRDAIERKAMKVGDTVEVILVEPFPGTEVCPPLKLGQTVIIREIIQDSAGNPHFDVGLESKHNFIRSIETGEHLPRGDKIHWCHPTRFKLATPRKVVYLAMEFDPAHLPEQLSCAGTEIQKLMQTMGMKANAIGHFSPEGRDRVLDYDFHLANVPPGAIISLADIFEKPCEEAPQTEASDADVQTGQ